MSEQFITKRDEVKALLRKLFRSEDADLDFGIYRIMNYKRREIEQFIDQDLIETAEAEFKQYAKVGTADLEKKLEKLKSEINSNFGTRTINSEGRVTRNHDAPKVQRYLRTQEEYMAAALTEEQVNDVFNHVYEFFSRYYNDGDFIARPRDSWNSKYSIPYKGEEVALYWATKNMYYIKTGEFFKKYNFKAGRYKVNFVLVDAQVETGNAIGKKKFFLLSDEDQVQIDEAISEVKIRFNYRELSDVEKAKYGTRNIQATLVSEILEKIRPLLESSSIVGFLRPRGGEEKSLIEKHLNAYVNRNTKDFFIHKDLMGFLEREIDFYLKNEVWSLEELELSSESGARLLAAKVKAIRGISLKIIEFLSQIEEFQKRLFEKKKFVLKTDYCITLDLVPEELYEEICRNDKQIEEWKELYKLDEIIKGNFSTKGKTTLTIAFLRQYKYLILDTNFFSIEFKDKLFQKLDINDDVKNGLLIKSENIHALNLCEAKYKDLVKCIYIDPPYNTGKNNFLYKDNYQHSSWMSMMYDRLLLSKKLLRNDGVIFISIDDREVNNLKILCDYIYGSNNLLSTFKIKVRHEKRILRGDKDYQEVMEYLLAYRKTSKYSVRKIEKDTDGEKNYIYKVVENINSPKIDYIGGYEVHIFDLGDYTIEKTLPSKNNFKRYTIRGSLIDMVGSASEFYELYLRDRKRNDGLGTLYKVINMGVKGDGLGYRYIMQPIKETSKNGIYFQGYPLKSNERKYIPYPTYFDFVNEFNNVKDEADTPFNDGKKPVKFIMKFLEICGIENEDYILDFFAGSGTLGDACIQYSNKHNIKLNYVMCEMGDFFDDILVKRMKKSVYSNIWQNSIPQNLLKQSCFIKYIYLEQYEDTLNNIEFRRPDGTIQRTLERFPDYFISYMLDYETRDSPTRLSIEQFKTPFDYKIRTLSGGEEREEPIDLVETFNYLLGLHIKRIHAYRDGDRVYRVIFGERESKQVAVIWRNTSGLDLRRDKRFIEENILVDSNFDTIYVNGDSYIRNAKTIEPEFRRLMGA